MVIQLGGVGGKSSPTHAYDAYDSSEGPLTPPVAFGPHESLYADKRNNDLRRLRGSAARRHPSPRNRLRFVPLRSSPLHSSARILRRRQRWISRRRAAGVVGADGPENRDVVPTMSPAHRFRRTRSSDRNGCRDAEQQAWPARRENNENKKKNVHTNTYRTASATRRDRTHSGAGARWFGLII